MISKLSGILQEGDGSDLVADLARNVLNFVDEAAVLRIFDLETREAQLKACYELAGRIMQFLAQSPALVVQSAKQLLHPVRLPESAFRARRPEVEG